MAKKDYGNKGQVWNKDFIEYMKFIANHEMYAGMPDAFVGGGKIQWEAPSNRGSGQFKDTHHKRRDWWRKKASEIGVDPNSNNWISRVAKKIHPTKKKPCKRCGRVMEVRYAYPQAGFLKRVTALGYVPKDFPLDPLEHITSLVARLYEAVGQKLIADLPALFKTGLIKPPSFKTMDEWLAWLESTYIPAEPSVLSPGAMSNAPDRFDGFHSFNLCCRSKADTGRHRENLATYTTDRRVFEYWADGDWVAADRLMGQLRAKFKKEPCLNGHDGPCDADHIGPISLGFSHRPEFQLLCSTCNSAKNNRMTRRDVTHLLAAEAGGATVISWHSRALWDLRKASVTDDETALRISKMLRDNRHSLMSILNKIAAAKHYTFLASLLNLNYADFDIDFNDLVIKNHLTSFTGERRTGRVTKYASEQKARRCRIAFAALSSYFAKENRSEHVVTNAAVEQHVKAALGVLGGSEKDIKTLDAEIEKVLTAASDDQGDTAFRALVQKLPKAWPADFVKAKEHLVTAMAEITKVLSSRWTDDRYIRAEGAFD